MLVIEIRRGGMLPAGTNVGPQIASGPSRSGNVVDDLILQRRAKVCCGCLERKDRESGEKEVPFSWILNTGSELTSQNWDNCKGLIKGERAFCFGHGWLRGTETEMRRGWSRFGHAHFPDDREPGRSENLTGQDSRTASPRQCDGSQPHPCTLGSVPPSQTDPSWSRGHANEHGRVSGLWLPLTTRAAGAY